MFWSKDRSAKEQQERKQILNLFVPGEKMIPVRVSQRLSERTAGRGSLHPDLVFQHLEALVEEGKLLKQVTPFTGPGICVKKIEYFLPQEGAQQ